MTEPTKRLSVSDITEVYFQAPNTILDGVHPVTGKPVWGETDYEGQPGVERISFDDALARQADHWRSEPSEITKAQFWEMLEVLPPVDWCNWSNSESFKMSERLSGIITGIYVRIGCEAVGTERYYTFNDDCTMKHDAIVAKVLEWRAKR